MKFINTKVREYILGAVILFSFALYYFDVLKDGMMISGIFAVIIMLYISMIWRESVVDERDEYIRSKTDRYLYIITLFVILLDVIYKTFAHESYMSDVVILTILSLSKIFLGKFLKDRN